ncbi:MAG: hypothetical protein Q4F93_07290 [bacterium]|nr:hypothetical protein [bacterium]
MSIKVTVRNYMFPITFSYKGWDVKLEKRVGLFKDIPVEATFTPTDPIYNDKVLLEDDRAFMSLANRYVASLHLPNTQFARFSANGGLLDKFLGQNISATQKVIDKVTSYIDSNLPYIKPFDLKEYLTFLVNNGINSKTLSVLLMMRKFRQ